MELHRRASIETQIVQNKHPLKICAILIIYIKWSLSCRWIDHLMKDVIMNMDILIIYSYFYERINLVLKHYIIPVFCITYFSIFLNYTTIFLYDEKILWREREEERECPSMPTSIMLIPRLAWIRWLWMGCLPFEFSKWRSW